MTIVEHSQRRASDLVAVDQNRSEATLALIKHLERIELDARAKHSETEATYSIVTGEDGHRLLQIDTYGSKNRRTVGQKSQSIRFTREALDELHSILTQLKSEPAS